MIETTNGKKINPITNSVLNRPSFPSQRDTMQNKDYLNRNW